VRTWGGWLLAATLGWLFPASRPSDRTASPESWREKAGSTRPSRNGDASPFEPFLSDQFNKSVLSPLTALKTTFEQTLFPPLN